MFAQVLTPGAGWHFYIAGHPDLATCHKVLGWPGVDIQSHGTLLYVPGTSRPKYRGGGYVIIDDDLTALADGWDTNGAEMFADWVAQHRGGGTAATFAPSQPWSGGAPGKREAAYMAATLSNVAIRVADAPKGEKKPHPVQQLHGLWKPHCRGWPG